MSWSDGQSPFPVQQLQVCAWRVKYLISTGRVLTGQEWYQFAKLWEGGQLECIPVAGDKVLYKLLLPEKQGILTGSSERGEIYAVLLRQERLLVEVIRRLFQVLEKPPPGEHA